MWRKQFGDYMPRDHERPTGCMFSTPKFSYSEDTKRLVKTLMDESKLTFQQKTGFQAILRNGQPLPSHPSDLAPPAMPRYYAEKHAYNASRMGIPVLPRKRRRLFASRLSYGQKRSQETIEELNKERPPIGLRNYVPRNLEAEKDNLSHSMAFGKPSAPNNIITPIDGNDVIAKGRVLPLNPNKPGPNNQVKSVEEMKRERLIEIVDEIDDRIEFLESTCTTKEGKSYRVQIVPQIHLLVAEAKNIDPEHAEEMIRVLQLREMGLIGQVEPHENNIITQAYSENNRR